MGLEKPIAGAAGEIPEAVLQALDLFGRALNAACIYGPRHARTRQWLEKAFAGLQPIIAESGPLNFNLVDGSVRINGHLIAGTTPWTRMLKARMQSGGADGFSITSEAGIDEYIELLNALATARPGELKAQLEQSRIKGILPSQMRIQALSATEVVVDEKTTRAPVPTPSSTYPGEGVLDLEEEAGGAVASPVQTPEQQMARAASDAGVSPKQFQNIIAFIKGGAGAHADSGVSGALNRAAADPEKLATLITESAVIRKGELPSGSGESLADIVVGCLRRTLDQVRPSLAAESDDTGAPSAQKSLLVLERLVMDKLRAFMGPVDAGTRSRIHAAIREFGEQARTDHAALQLMEARATLTAQEREVLALIREKGPDAFKGTVLERGLSSKDWQELVVQAGARGSGGGGSGQGAGGGEASIPMPQAISTLADVLGRFDELMKMESPPLEQMRTLVKEINATVGDVVDDAGERMAQFEKHWNDIRNHRAGMEGVEKLMGRISELTQELLQPITVIKTVLSMLNESNAPGEAQTELIKLASASGDQLKDLMDRLLRIVGLPASLSPDVGLVYGSEGKTSDGGRGPGSTAGS